MKEIIKKYWNQDSNNYQKSAKISTDSAHYGPYAPNENKLKLLGNIKNKNILEIGCGGGQCSIAFAKQGAICTGLDLSIEQLKYAEKLATKKKVKVNFLLKDIQTLKGIKSNSYDIVFSTFALQYIPNLNKCFKEVNRVLKKNGLFVFSFDHPFYSTIDPKTLKIIFNYNNFKIWKETIVKPDGTKSKFVAYPHKISDTYSALINANFIIEQIIEPFDEKIEKGWKNSYWKKIYPLKLIKMIGPTIIFKTKKNNIL
jgi:ubiquinone/menaquinone biosynthesis C-methylase UbiE